MLNISLLVISFVLAIYILEIFLHVAKPRFLQLQASVTGEFTDFTGRGFFPAEFGKKNGACRILGISDSYGQNGRGKWNYHDFLQKRFDELYGSRKVEVINAGIAATGPGYYWNTIERHGDLIQPDVVLIGFFIGNDFLELKFDEIRIGQYITEPRELFARFLGYLQFKNLWVYQFSQKRSKVLVDQFKKKRETGRVAAKEKGTFSRENFLFIERSRLTVCEQGFRPWYNKAWKDDADVFLKMKQWCDKRGIKLIVAVFPDEFQVDHGLLKEVMEKYNIKSDKIDLLYPNKLLKDYFEQYDILYIDLTAALQEAAKFKKLYLINDTHWNEAGNREAGDLIFDFLQKKQLVNIKNASKGGNIVSHRLQSQESRP
jgi:hypothetical protein